MVNKYFEGEVPTYVGQVNEVDSDLEEYTKKQNKLVEDHFEKFEFANSLQELWNIIARTNKYIDETAPWVLQKEEETEKLASCMNHLIENLRKIGIMLLPFMEKTAKNLLTQIGLDKQENTWESIYELDQIPNGTKVIEKGEPLFMRLNVEEEIDYIKKGMGV